MPTQSQRELFKECADMLKAVLDSYEVELECDKVWSRCGKEDLLSICSEIFASDPPLPIVQRVEEARVKLLGNPASAAQEPGDQPKKYELRGASFLFTWNIGVPEDTHTEWVHFLAWRLRQAVGKCASSRFSATMEESLESADAGRVHIHEQRELCTRIDGGSLDPYKYLCSSWCAFLACLLPYQAFK